MQQTPLFCHHCQKQFSVALEDIRRVQRFDPEHLILAAGVYSYSGGCFFKQLGRLKALERQRS